MIVKVIFIRRQIIAGEGTNVAYKNFGKIKYLILEF
jgi:hypothetical protein